MQYRIQLDTKNQLFVAIDAHDQNHFGTGRTIEQAIHQLKATNKTPSATGVNFIASCRWGIFNWKRKRWITGNVSGRGGF